jgi:quercetin dioxygenase-like cupin family protein
VGAIFRVNEHDVAWSEYARAASGSDGKGRAPIRYKALTMHEPGVPPVQYVEYASGHADPMHSHETGEFLVVTAGTLWLEDEESGPGSIIFIPRDTEYSVRGGEEGARFFRVVVA